MKRSGVVWCLLFAFIAANLAFAQVPQLINYQGRLLNGTNLVNGSVGLSLRLFNVASGGSVLYEDSNTVAVVDGLYSTFIGDNTTSGDLVAALTNAAVYVEVAVNGSTLSPRERLASVGYSLATRGLLVTTNSSVVLNPETNTVHPSSHHSTIGGGEGNSIRSNASWSVLGGGALNNIHASAIVSVLGGGGFNSIQTNAWYSFLGGGFQNTIQSDASGSFLGGGAGCSIQTNAQYAFLGGGYQNSIGLNAPYAAIPGGKNNAVGNGAISAFAAGYRAKANHAGTFVWADKQEADFASTANNQFLIRAAGGVGIGKTNPVSALDVAGTVTAAGFAGDASGLTNVGGAQLAPNIGVWAKNGTSISYSSGNVGIGTTTPTEKVEVAGWMKLNGPYGKLADLSTLVNSAQLLIGWNQSGGEGEADFIANRGPGNVGGFAFYDLDNEGTLNPLMTMKGDGRVGIGTSTPTHELTVQAPSGSDVISFRNPSYELGRLGIGAHADGGSLWLKSDGAWKVAINADDVSYFNGGNVGIGTANPAEPLEVVGRILLNGPEGNLDGDDLSALTNSAKMLIGWNRSAGGGEADFIANRGPGDVGGFSFFDMANNGTVNHLMTLKGNGRVGIGTYSPTEQLDVAGAVKIGNTANPAPAAGTIRWTGTDFQGYDGTRWTSLRSGATPANMVLVPGGTFTMGSDAVGAIPEHQVTLSSFYIGKYEVSYALWYTNKARATTSYGYNFQNAGREGDDGTNGAAPTAAGSEPVTMVSWRDAIVWCNARSEIEGLTPVYTYGGAVIRDSRDANACDNAVFNTANNGYRLPTEAEWEYAARYVDGWSWTPGDFPSGSGFNFLNDPACSEVAWYTRNSSNDTHVVGTKKANQLGLHDMSGNVDEWCWDWLSGTYYDSSPETDPHGPASGSDRVLRGGSKALVSGYCRVAYRDFYLPYAAYGDVGFRVALPPGQ